MASRNSVVVTFNGSAQLLSTAIGYDRDVKELWLQADEGNTHKWYGGFANDPATSGIYFPAPASTVPHAPWNPLEGDQREYLKLSDLYVQGTNGEKVRVSWIGLQAIIARRVEG